MKRLAIAVAVSALFSGAALAQQGTVQRDVNQQQRIEDGLKSGQLSTQEASRLEAEQARIQRDQANALRNGNLSPAEKARLEREQNNASRDINRLENNAQKGNPNSASSQRMQADVQRNINQQQRIEQGLKAGQLTNKEAGRLERGEAKVDRREAHAGRDGHVSAAEQRRIQGAENHESRKIHHEKHDAQHR
jgi:hypothetical protein